MADRKFEIVVRDCPDDFTAFEVCEAIRTALDSKCSVSAKEEKEED